MAKNHLRIVRIFPLLFLATLAYCNPALGQTRADLVRVYRGEVGVREATGRNDGAKVSEYLRTVHLGPGHAWCAAFVSWSFAQAGISALRSGWSPAWFPVSHLVYRRGDALTYRAELGDVLGIYYPHLDRIAHVGFVDGMQGNFLLTVEGNTNEAGGRQGDGVYRKRRPLGTVHQISRWVFQ